MDLKQLTKDVQKVSEGYSAHFKIKRDSDWFILKLQEELGELIQVYLMMIGQARAKGKTKKEMKADFDSEVADVLGMILLLASHFDVDIDKAMEEKWLKWNK